MAQTLAGRDPELRATAAALREGHRTVCVTGDPGVGKSSLLAATIDRARAEGWQVLALRGGAIARRGCSRPST